MDVFVAGLAISIAAAQVAAEPADQRWPTQPPGKVLATPDWSDYRIYPKAALRRNAEGNVDAEALIGTDGLPKACRIINTSNFPELDNGTCELIMTMRFEPAHDQAGNPVESRFAKRIGWRLTDPMPFGSARIVIRARIAGERLTECEITEWAGPFADLWRRTSCSFLRDVPYFFGTHAGDRSTALIEVRLDALDGSPIGQIPWPEGIPIASEKIRFSVNGRGDPTDCTPLEQQGFGPRGLNNLSPCSRFLSSLWIDMHRLPEQARTGTIETRVYLLN